MGSNNSDNNHALVLHQVEQVQNYIRHGYALQFSWIAGLTAANVAVGALVLGGQFSDKRIFLRCSLDIAFILFNLTGIWLCYLKVGEFKKDAVQLDELYKSLQCPSPFPLPWYRRTTWTLLGVCAVMALLWVIGLVEALG